MGDFNSAYKKVMKVEGGYCNRKADAGGETYKGISRKYHAEWAGWDIVDRIKATAYSADFSSELKYNVSLQVLVEQFYKKHFWDKLRLDNVSSYKIALKLFDMAVNCGVSRTGKWLQTTLNVLNRYGKDWKDIVVDGRIGNTTIGVCNKAVKKRKRNILKALNILQGSLYIKLALSPKRRDELNINGWLGHRIGFINISKGEE